MSSTSGAVVLLSGLISGITGIAGSLIQRWFYIRDEKRKEAQRKAEKALEDVLLSDSAIISEIKPMLDRMRKEVDVVTSPIRNGVATSVPWVPEQRFYEAAQGLYYSTLVGYIQNEQLRAATDKVVTTLGRFIKATDELLLIQHDQRNYNYLTSKDYSQQVRHLQDERSQAMKDFVGLHEEFLRLVATTVGYHRLRPPVWGTEGTDSSSSQSETKGTENNSVDQQP